MDGGGNIKKYHAHLGRFPFYLKFRKFSVGTSNGTDHFDLVRPEYSGPALKVVHFDRFGHFGRSKRNNRAKCPFPFDNIVVPSTSLLYPAYGKFPKFQNGIFVEWKAPLTSWILNKA